MLKFPNTRYSKAWKQHVKPPSEMEYSRVINRKRWEEEEGGSLHSRQLRSTVCLLAALARPSFVENGSSRVNRAKAARKQHLGRESRSFVLRRHHGLRSRPNVGEYVAKWRGCAPRFAFPFHGGASWRRGGTRQEKNSPPFSLSSERKGILSSRVKSGFRWV